MVNASRYDYESRFLDCADQNKNCLPVNVREKQRHYYTVDALRLCYTLAFVNVHSCPTMKFVCQLEVPGV